MQEDAQAKTAPEKAASLEADDSLRDWKKEIEDWKRRMETTSIDSSIAALQMLISRPSPLFDSYAVMAALEEVVDLLKEKKDERATRFAVVLRQCRPLIGNSSLQQVLIKLVATKEEVEVAKSIAKALMEQQSPPREAYRPSGGRSRRGGYRGRRGIDRPRSQRCYRCDKEGHYARACPDRRS